MQSWKLFNEIDWNEKTKWSECGQKECSPLSSGSVTQDSFESGQSVAAVINHIIVSFVAPK